MDTLRFHPKTAKRRRDRGFTLLEVLIAVFVLAFGLLGLAGFMSQMSIGTTDSRYNELAAMLASEKLEDLNRIPNTDPSMLNNGGNLGGPTTASYTTANGPDVVAYYDQVYISTDNGAATEYIQGTNNNVSPSQTGYWTISHTPSGTASAVFTQSAGGLPASTVASGMAFQRLWTVELNPTVGNGPTTLNGVRRITVLVTLASQGKGLNNAARFQATMVRP